MKTLNKTLCLVLAMVMVLGLFGVASAADFTDQADVKYTEAVGVMTGIGAINGMGDGTFAPKGDVTRAQAAKLVAYAVLGADVAAKLPAGKSSFTDVDANTQSWAGGAIEYFVSKGVINGKGDGTFDPNGKVTGNEIAKMMLVAAGYGKNGEYTGTSWELNVAIDAAKAKLFKDSEATDNGAAATREEAALITFNGINVELVAWSKDSETYIPADKDADVVNTIATAIYGMKTVEGVVVDNQATGEKATTIETYAPAASPAPEENTESSYDIATGLDMIGHYVRVTYKTPYTSETAKGVTYSVTDLSTIVTVDKTIATAAAWKTAFGSTSVTNIAGELTQNVDGEYVVTESAVTGMTINSAAAKGTYVLYKNDIKAFIAAATYTADVVVSYTAPTANATGKIVLADAGTITIPKTGDDATVNVYATPAAKDVVTVATTGAIKTITKATTAEGKVTAVKTDATTGVVTISAGSAYTVSAVDPMETGDFETLDNTMVNNTYTFYMAPDGTVIAAVLKDLATDAGLVYVVKTYAGTTTASYGDTTTPLLAQCVDMTGKEVTYTIGMKVNSTYDSDYEDESSDDALIGAICTVKTATNSTYKTEMATIALASTLATQGVTTNSVAVAEKKDNDGLKATDKTIDNDNDYIDATTQFIFVRGEGATLKVTTATGAQAITAKLAYNYYSTKTATAKNYTVKYVVVAGASVNSDESVMFAPLAFNKANAVSYTKDGKSEIGYANAAFIDGAPKTDVLVDDTAAMLALQGSGVTFFTYAVDENGLYTMTPYTGKFVALANVDNVYGNLLSVTGVDGSGAATLTDADASKAKIVDAVYMLDVMKNGSAATTTQITTLSGLINDDNNAIIFCTYKEESGVQTIDTIYIVAHSNITIAVQPFFAANKVTIGAGNTLAGLSDTYKSAISYQWEKCDTIDGTYEDVSGAEAAAYTLGNADANGYYRCVVTNTTTGIEVTSEAVQATYAG